MWHSQIWHSFVAGILQITGMKLNCFTLFLALQKAYITYCFVFLLSCLVTVSPRPTEMPDIQ